MDAKTNRVEAQGLIEKVVTTALAVDRVEAAAMARAAREAHPGESNEELGARFFREASWKAAAVGTVSGLPSNPFVAVPAAIADAGAVLRIEVSAAAKVAALYDPAFALRSDEPWDLLVPLLGVDLVSQALRAAGIALTTQLTRGAIKAALRKEGLAVFKRLVLRAFGVKITQRAVLTKTIPFVGAVVGGGWNLAEVRLVGERVVAYFKEDGPEPAKPPFATQAAAA